MSKAKPKRSGREPNPARKASTSTGSATKSGKNRTSPASGKRTPPQATKSKRTTSKPTMKGRASVTEAKPRAAAQSTPRQARRQFELPTLPALQHENMAIEVKAEPLPLQDLQSQRPLEVAKGRERMDVDDNSQPEPPTVAQPPATTRRSPLLGVMRANVEIQQVMTRRAVATVQFAASLARCRSPMDLWAAQLRFVSDFLHPGGPRK